MWKIPDINAVTDFARQLACSYIAEVPVFSEAAYEHDCCHSNVDIHVSLYGGRKVSGYYFLEGFGTVQAIAHSVWDGPAGIQDITPYRDDRTYNVFAIGPIVRNNYYLQSFAKYMQEIEIMYYVYQLVDPRTNLPFYIGKGKGNRAKYHLYETARVENKYKDNKIRAIRSAGHEPRIDIVAENIPDESLAYDIEKELIIQWGRKGYEPGGILTNVCEDNRPPSHKGKTYEEIYGARAEEQRKKRADLQRAAGGWFKGYKHTLETKKILSEKTSGKNNPRWGVRVSGTPVADKISKANRGKKHHGRADVRVLYIEGIDTLVYSNDLKDFCKKHGYSLGTFYKQLYEGWSVSKRGKNKGLRIRQATLEEQEDFHFD